MVKWLRCFYWGSGWQQSYGTGYLCRYGQTRYLTQGSETGGYRSAGGNEIYVYFSAKSNSPFSPPKHGERKEREPITWLFSHRCADRCGVWKAFNKKMCLYFFCVHHKSIIQFQTLRSNIFCLCALLTNEQWETFSFLLNEMGRFSSCWHFDLMYVTHTLNFITFVYLSIITFFPSLPTSCCLCVGRIVCRLHLWSGWESVQTTRSSAALSP